MSTTPAYAGSYADCGCIVAVTLDKPEHRLHVAKEVSSWLHEGLTVNRRTVDEIKADPAYFRDCGGPAHPVIQPRLVFGKPVR